MKTIIVIPARLASSRLPRKLLLAETGKSVLQHTYEQASLSQLADGVVVACDHPEIESEVKRFGGQVMMTRPDHVCGTDRVAEAARHFDANLIVNVQGDEPEIDPAAIDLLIDLLQNNTNVPVATLAAPIRKREQLDNPACVKVVFDASGRALYFSRSPIPHPRNWDVGLLDGSSELLAGAGQQAQVPSGENQPIVAAFWQHIGLYGYRRDFLMNISSIPATAIEKIESLEQLRFLHAGNTMLVGKVEHSAAGIDTPEDYAAFVSRQKT